MAHRDTKVERRSASDEAVGCIYEATLDAAAWPRALGLIAQDLGARSAMAFAIDLTDFTVGFRAAAGMAPATLDDYAREWARRDPLLAHGAARPAGEPFLGQDAMDEAGSAQGKAFAMFPGQHAIGGFAARNGAVALACMAFQPRAAGAFGAAELRRMGALFPHLARTARIHRRLARADGIADGLTEALRHVPLAAILCDPAGRLLWLNPLAEELARRCQGLRLIDGRIAAANGAGAELRRLMAGNGGDKTGDCAAASGHVTGGPATNEGDWLQLPRPWPLKPLTAMVVPLGQREPWPDLTLGPARPTALLLISDPERAVQLPAGRLAHALGLTAAEARLTAALAGGANLNDYAASAHITIGTARWYLKQALAKTGAHRQSELVRQAITAAGVEGVGGADATR